MNFSGAFLKGCQHLIRENTELNTVNEKIVIDI